MKVSEAVSERRSIRAFTKKPIDNSLIESLLKQSSFAPSGGNLQPWRIYVLNKDSMASFLEFQETWDMPEKPGYDIYPPNLKEPYRSSRFEVGEQMYSLLGISRENKEARINQVMKNFNFFGAPAAIFCYVDREMGPPQWSDLGMFLQTFMLLAQEVGLDTCAQEAWAMKHESVSSFLQASESDMLFCGMAIGYKDQDSPINQLKTTRRPTDEWMKFI
ncbi:nitroreductase [Gammaproteobacteria bacterium]|nr:nitroreductase [Gammaproteobacteria bacterium]|tara:strand:+ start:8163 stop:8816 length:654 start_codon:yes stop_codon:yes gene_type:complete